MSDATNESYSEEEAARRRDEALRRALSTPPQPKASPNPTSRNSVKSVASRQASRLAKKDKEG